jgi:hypothetical protein
MDISARRFRCCMFLSSLLREASSKVGVWRTYIENQYEIVISAIENIVSIPMTLVILLRASRVSLGVDIDRSIIYYFILFYYFAI